MNDEQNLLREKSDRITLGVGIGIFIVFTTLMTCQSTVKIDQQIKEKEQEKAVQDSVQRLSDTRTYRLTSWDLINNQNQK